MEKRHLTIPLLASSALILSVLLIPGCGVSVRPDTIPVLKGYENVSLTGASLLVTNTEQDSVEYVVRNDSGAKSGITANRWAWSKMFVEALAGELSRRGAQVRINAPVTLGIAVPEITFNQFGNIYQFRVVVTASLSTGWSRDYEGIAEAGLKAFESRAAMFNRLAGEALAEAVKSMLRDDEFLMRIRQIDHKE